MARVRYIISNLVQRYLLVAAISQITISLVWANWIYMKNNSLLLI